MPRPPLLPTIDWPSVFSKGLHFDEWLEAAESSERREAMTEALHRLRIPSDLRGRLQAALRPVHVVAIAEDWCGDVVRHVPALELVSRSCPVLSARYITREQFPEVFVRFLTNGGEAIPKFVFLNETFTEYANWGAMPESCKRLIARGKALGNVGSARVEVSARYDADPDLDEVFAELVDAVLMGQA